MKKKIFKGIMLFWTLFIGLGAVLGSTCMLIRPDGSILHMQEMLPYFSVLPFSNILFQNYIFSGISLLIVNGISNLTAAVLIIKNKLSGAYLGCIFGFTLMLWITIQFVIFPANFLSISYFIFGALQFICGYLYIIFFKQNLFTFNESDYPNISENSDTVVVFFSRLGYTKKAAYEKANSIGASICEITTNERINGFLGFAWLGRFGMHKWPMSINKIDKDIASYQKVILVSPVYVFTPASPILGFCHEYRDKLKNVETILIHFRKDSDFKRAFDILDKQLNVKAEKKTSIVCKYGICIKEKVI